jgi:hypothetical protein
MERAGRPGACGAVHAAGCVPGELLGADLFSKRPAPSLETKKSPAPLYHAATKAAREAFWESYSAFVVAFREAAERLKAGDRAARFPRGSFPPGLPFVSVYSARPP